MKTLVLRPEHAALRVYVLRGLRLTCLSRVNLERAVELKIGNYTLAIRVSDEESDLYLAVMAVTKLDYDLHEAARELSELMNCGGGAAVDVVVLVDERPGRALILVVIRSRDRLSFVRCLHRVLSLACTNKVVCLDPLRVLRRAEECVKEAMSRSRVRIEDVMSLLLSLKRLYNRLIVCGEENSSRPRRDDSRHDPRGVRLYVLDETLFVDSVALTGVLTPPRTRR